MPNNIIVNKFGGGILKKDYIPLIRERLLDQISNNKKPVAIVSAMPGITDNILDFLNKLKENYNNEIIDNFIEKLFTQHKIIIEDIGISGVSYENVILELRNILDLLSNDLKKFTFASNEIEDKIVSFGERISSIIFTEYLNFSGLKSYKIFAEDIPIVTDNNFKNANINYLISEKNLNKYSVENDKGILVIPGFTGTTNDGKITTLGRGGTDTTACFVGASFRAEKIILWKDVGGILSSDPKIIKKTKTIPFINYYEAEEAGKIIHEKAIPFVKMFKTPIEINSIVNPKLKTVIGDEKITKKGAKILSLKKDLDFILITDESIRFNDLLSLVVDIFDKYKIEITLISNTRYSLQILIDDKNKQLENAYNELLPKVEKIEKTKADMVFLVGLFEEKDVSKFNNLLVKKGVDLLISAFYYEDCYRMEAIIKSNNINDVMKSVYKKFIR
jgi:aspartate kinase